MKHHIKLTKLITIVVFLIALVAAIPAGLVYANATETALVTVSGSSPYATCSNTGQPGTNYPNAEVEPYVAFNPATIGTTHVNVVGVWQQDRWNNGGAHGLVAGFSSDRGATWSLRGTFAGAVNAFAFDSHARSRKVYAASGGGSSGTRRSSGS